MAVKSIMIVGVGGQGTLLASRLLGSALIDSGYEVKVSEIHGMSQRGGSVVTYVKYGDEVFSPTIEQGEADIILAFEKLEAARWLSFLKPDGKLVVNDQCIDPMPVITGAAEYPQNISEAIDIVKANGRKVGLSVKPKTPAAVLYPFIDRLDMVLVMTVEPGFGGQSFMENTMPKIKTLREKCPDIDIEVDGGINYDTVKIAGQAGANVFVAGSAVFNDNITASVKALMEAV